MGPKLFGTTAHRDNTLAGNHWTKTMTVPTCIWLYTGVSNKEVQDHQGTVWFEIISDQQLFNLEKGDLRFFDSK